MFQLNRQPTLLMIKDIEREAPQPAPSLKQHVVESAETRRSAVDCTTRTLVGFAAGVIAAMPQPFQAAGLRKDPREPDSQKLEERARNFHKYDPREPESQRMEDHAKAMKILSKEALGAAVKERESAWARDVLRKTFPFEPGSFEAFIE